MDVTEVCDAIGEALKVIPGLKVYRRGYRGSLVTPFVQIFPPEEVNYDLAFGQQRASFTEATFLLLFGVHLAKVDGQDLMEQFLSSEGERSIYLALTADRTLGGAVSAIHSLGGVTRSYPSPDSPGEWLTCIDFQFTVIVGPRTAQTS